MSTVGENAAGLTELLRELVRIDSVNPAFSGGRSSELPIAERVARELRNTGLDVDRYETVPGRVSVVGRLPGRGTGPSLLLYAHLDTVGVEEMADPFSGDRREGRLYGRGAYDMKGGLAACLWAARTVAEEDGALDGDLLVAAVADEETESLGMFEVLRHVRPTAAIVTEPTELQLGVAHKGFLWLEAVARGRAAHGSRPHLGRDANLGLATALTGLRRLERRYAEAPGHPLLGRPSVHVGTLAGGVAPSVYAARSRAQIERRTLPGERREAVVAELEEALAAGSEPVGGVRLMVQPLLHRSAFEARKRSPLAAVLRRVARERLGEAPAEVGISFWTDAALLADAGVDAILFGPAGDGAHADEEWVDLASVARVAEILAEAARAYCRRESGGSRA